ncbi:acetyltransferase%2C GNAT family protein [Streptococcus pneumoniae]|nr:acetyltransferase%2C GNAT family protein [Streptococcus pneumoniae]
MPVNEYGQMIGESMEGYTPGELPSIDFLEGRYARIEALFQWKSMRRIC